MIVTSLPYYSVQTSDIQTACLVAGQAMPFTPKEKIVTSWFERFVV